MLPGGERRNKGFDTFNNVSRMPQLNSNWWQVKMSFDNENDRKKETANACHDFRFIIIYCSGFIIC